MAELKKCPFCGSKAKVLEHYNEGTVEICCADEFGTCYILPHTEEGFHLHEVEKDWNNRATEAEIRVKAIDEFAEKIRDWQKEVYKNDRYAGELDFLFKHIYEISEQLKERE